MNATPDPPRRRGRPPSGSKEAIIAATVVLLREKGIANVTSREVAARAGVSDASVYYHFGDRNGLLKAVFEHSVKPLQFMEQIGEEPLDRRAVLEAAVQSLDHFFIDVLPVLHAAQSDAELGTVLSEYIDENDLGPHRGVQALGAYLRSEQKAGRVNPRIDPEAVALLVIDIAFANATRRQMLRRSAERLPSADRLLAQINELLD